MLEIKHATTREVLLRLDGDTWEGRNLASAALDGANLSNLRLNHSILRQARLRRADLTGALLSEACLDGANLERARLSRCNLTSATLLDAVLIGADLRKSILRYASLAGASCEGANLTGADMSMCDARANFRQANLSGCDLRGANLVGANLQQANLTDADLTGANLAGAIMIGAKTHGARLPAISERTDYPLPTVPDDKPLLQHSEPAGRRLQRRPTGRPRVNADWVSRSGPDFESIDVCCPDCGAATRVKHADLNGNYRCRKCQSLFRLNDATTVKATKRQPARATPWQPSKPPSKFARHLARAAIALIALVTFAVVGFFTISWWRSSTNPKNLPDRSVEIVVAFIDKSKDHLISEALPSSASLVAAWLGRRPPRWDGFNGNPKPQLQVVKFAQGPTQATAAVRISWPGPAAGNPTPNGDPDAAMLYVCWTADDDGRWYFDPAASLKTEAPK